jgi:predicted alpha/beta-hydrolase family hydrolase
VASGIATLRYQFPYMEEGRRAPNPPGVLTATVRAAVATAAKQAKGLPIFAGGKSLGGRMTSTAASKEPLPGVRGLVFFGFPLHAPGKPGRQRAAHLAGLDVPMLFLQGTRDKLAELPELRPVLDGLGKRATLHVVDDGDHSFHVPKRSGRSDDAVLDDLCDTVARWSTKLS